MTTLLSSPTPPVQPLPQPYQAHRLSHRPSPPHHYHQHQGGKGERRFPSLFSPMSATAAAANSGPSAPEECETDTCGSRSRSASGYSSSEAYDEVFTPGGGRTSSSLSSSFFGHANASSLAVAAAAPGVGGGGRRGGEMGLVSRGRTVKRLAKKIGALVRDPSPDSSLEAFQVEEARLRLWVRSCARSSFHCALETRLVS